jgi:hypothetical protein
MKQIKNFLFAAMSLAMFGCAGFEWPASAADTRLPFHSSGFTAAATNLSYAVISANGRGVPVVTFASATVADTEGLRLIWRSGTVTTFATGTNTTFTIPVTHTNGFLESAIVIIRHRDTDTYERAVIGSIFGNEIDLLDPPTHPVSPGDIIYATSSAGSGVVVGATGTTTLNGPVLFSGRTAGKPLLVQILGTNAPQKHVVTARFIE